MKRFTEVKGYRTPDGEHYFTLEEAAKFEILAAISLGVVDNEILELTESIIENADTVIDILQEYIDCLPTTADTDVLILKGGDQ